MTKQGTQNSHPLTGELLDLDELLARRALAPVPVKLGGKTYRVRTDMTGQETAQFIAFMREQKDLEAFALLVGQKDAVTLNAYLDNLPRMHQALVSSRIMHASLALAQYAKSEEEIYTEYGYEVDELEPAEQGESSAS